MDKTDFDALAANAIDYGDILNVIGLKRLGELVNDDATLDRPSYDVVRDMVLRAEAEVNGYLARRYEIPAIQKLSATDVVVPNQVWDWTASVLRYKLYKRRPVMPEDIETDYTMTIRQLELAGRGTIQIVELTLDSDGIPESETPTVVSTTGKVNRSTNILGRNYSDGLTDTGRFSV